MGRTRLPGLFCIALFAATASAQSLPSITTPSVPDGAAGMYYAAAMTATGGAPPYGTWTLASGELPPGLTLSADTGVISGIPTTQSGTPFNFSVTVQDSQSNISSPQSMTIAIGPFATYPGQEEVLASPRSASPQPLLIPFVTNQVGFDTTITITNTSADTLGSTFDSGACTIGFFGSGAPSPSTNVAVPGGTLEAGASTQFLLSSLAPGFQGYVTISCGFALARGAADLIYNAGQTNSTSVPETAQVLTLPRNVPATQSFLFPYVTNQAGFDTGFVVANTSTDPFGANGATPTSGSCTLNFYGAASPGTGIALPGGTLASGASTAFTLSSVAPGFQGYVIVQCNFGAAAAFAFVSNGFTQNGGYEYSATPEAIAEPRSSSPEPLLFPSVTNQNGNDTGIAIANTSLDNLGSDGGSEAIPTSGACTLSFYGSNAPGSFTTPSISAGTVYETTISSIAAGFQGYVTATCPFGPARGFAFVQGSVPIDNYSVTPEVVAVPRNAAPSTILFSNTTNAGSADTSITISNTSLDSFGTNPDDDVCTIDYFGGNSPGSQTTPLITAGSQYSFLLSQLAPGFSGYIIASCNFPLATGIAELNLGTAPSIVTSSLAAGAVDIAYSQTLSATGGEAPYQNWTVVSGSLPPGLTLNAATGVIGGTPTSAVGSPFTFSVTVQDSALSTSAPQTLSIAITAASTPAISSIINAASSTVPPLAPGSLATIFGLNLASSTTSASGTPLPFTLGGASITVNGTAAALSFVSPTQINFQVPYEAATGNATVVVTNLGSPSANFQLAVIPASPGINPATILNSSNSSQITAGAPIAPGGTAEVFFTGLGATNPAVADGAAAPSSPPLAVPVAASSVTIGGMAATVNFIGLAPSQVGLAQANVVVPAGLLAGSYPVVITVNGVASPPATIYVSGPASSLMTVTPSTVSAGSAATSVTISGTNFGGGETVSFTPPNAGSATVLTPTTIQATQIQVTIPSTLLTIPGTAQIAVTNGLGMVSGTVTLTITQAAPPPAPPLTLSGSLPQATAEEPYSARFSASGGVPPYSYSAGGLPSGIVINASTGAIGGQTTKTGSFIVIVFVTDSAGNSTSASSTLTVAPPPPVSLSGASLGSFVVGTPLSTVINAAGGAPPYTYALASGSLPPGLNLQSGGTLSGTPLTAGSYSFTVKVTDSSAGTASGTFSITITQVPLTLNAPSPLATGVVTIGYATQTIAAKGGTPPYTFAITTGSLPAGLTLSSTGNITGTPTAATPSGGASFTVTATDSSTPAATGTENLSIAVNPFTQNLILTAGSLSFSLAAGTTSLPPAQTVGVQSTMVSQPINYTVAVQPSSTAWLTATSGTTTPGSLSVGLTPAALSLAASTYTASVVVTCTSSNCAGNTQSIPVTLTVSSPPPQLTLQLTTLSFNTTSAAPQILTETLVVSNTGGGGIGFQSITCGAPWCTVSGIPGSLGAAVSANLTITVNPAGLSAGYYYTSISIVSSAGNASVPVTLSIAPNGLLSLSPAGAEFTLPQGGQLAPGSFLVNITGSTPVSYSAAVAAGAPYLNIVNGSGTASGTAPGTVTYAFDNSQIAQLAPGPYYATIAITAGGASNSPQSYEVVINVTPPTTPVVPNPTPGGLLFLTQATATPPAQTITVYSFTAASTAFQASASTTSGGNWLSVSPTTGSTSFSSPGTVNASVNPSGLRPGVYKGAVNFAFSATAVRSVNVTLIVENTGSATTSALSPKDATGTCTPSQLVLTSTGLVSNFSAPAAWPVPLSIVLVDDCGNLVNNGQIIATFSNGDPPLFLTLGDPTMASYTATWTPEHAAGQITINARATAPSFAPVLAQLAGAVTPNNAPILADLAIANFFNPIGGAPLAPGALVQITGQYLASQTVNAPSIPLPLTLGGTSVIIGGLQAPVSMVSPGEVFAQVPFELPAGQPYQVIINANNALTTPQSFQAGAASPGLGVLPNGFVEAGHASGAPVTTAAPAKPGETVSVYLVGMGATTIPVPSGQPGPSGTFATTVIAPVLTLNGENTTVSFSGLIPGLVGVYQVNFQVPSDAPNGNLTLSLVENGFTSNSGLLPVHN